jgi:hypothetical protein
VPPIGRPLLARPPWPGVGVPGASLLPLVDAPFELRIDEVGSSSDADDSGDNGD